MAYRFEIDKNKAREYRLHITAPNGEMMFATEGYASKISALNAIASVQSNGPSAVIDDRFR